MAAVAAGDETAGPAVRKLCFLDLPVETQRDILSHCAQSDMVCVALVSKHFHELASAQLYRSFHIIFPDDDDSAFDSPIDGLAGGLDTFTTSEYNYAKHLRELSMDTLAAGIKAELSYNSYLYSASCGKFLNTLLYLTLKKARSLETFRWNIRVELSRQVYRELHRIPSLKRLHIRMQAGESYYVPPPPLPIHPDMQGPEHATHWADVPPPPLPPPTIPSTNSLLFGGPPPIPSGPPPALLPPSKSLPKSKASRRAGLTKEPPTLSGFKDLKSLSVLDIDDLDILTELKTCVKNSASTLKSLQLSFSDVLASQARKPPPDSDADDSDVDDDFQVGPSAHNHANDSSMPVRNFRAQEERKVQEAVLGKILDVDLPALPTKSLSSKAADEGSKGKEGKPGDSKSLTGDPGADFIASLRQVSDQLIKIVHGVQLQPNYHQELLELIEKAARKYVESAMPAKPDADPSSKKAEAESSNTPRAEGEESSGPAVASGSKAGMDAESPSQAEAGGSEGSTSVAKDSKGKGKSTGNSDEALENIDMEHVVSIKDVEDDFDDQKVETKQPQDSEPPSTDLSRLTLASSTGEEQKPRTPAKETTTSIGEHTSYISGLLDRFKFFHSRFDSLRNQILTAEKEDSSERPQKVADLVRKMEICLEEIATLNKEIDASNYNIPRMSPEESDVHMKMVQQHIHDYLRETRGFCLEKLGIHMIPVKASVLSRAIDLASLRQLTLLNVGIQAPIWTLLSKENKVQPLPLRSVFTDNVSDAFLTCISQLKELHDFFILERNAKSRPESFASPTTNTMDQIRRMVLAKHLPTLKRIMIKDESGPSNTWDANEKTMIYICTRGKQLEELALSMNIQAVHALLQYLPGLKKLRALHILRFRNNDTCLWVMREILRFIVDNLSHHPESKLEWIAMEDERVDHVKRTSPADEKLKRERRKQQKKKKAHALTMHPPPAIHSHGGFPVMPSIGVGSESDIHTDDDGFEMGSRLRFKAQGPLQFYDVWGVKIFEKEIRTGRL